MGLNAWFIGVLGVFVILLIGLMFLFRKKRRLRFVISLFIVLILGAIFLHGVSFTLH